MAVFRSCDTTNIFVELSKALDGKKLKVGVYTVSGKPLYETTPDDLAYWMDNTNGFNV